MNILYRSGKVRNSRISHWIANNADFAVFYFDFKVLTNIVIPDKLL